MKITDFHWCDIIDTMPLAMLCWFLNSRLKEMLDFCWKLVKIKDVIFPIQVHRSLSFISAPWSSADPGITSPVPRLLAAFYILLWDGYTQCLALDLGTCLVFSSFFFWILTWILSPQLKARAHPSIQIVSLIIPIKMACSYGLSLSLFLSYGPFPVNLNRLWPWQMFSSTWE